MVKYAGDVQPFTLLENYINEPLMLTKDTAGNVRCLSNVYTHRDNIIAYKQCIKATCLWCRYYGRLIELSAKFVSMPKFKEVENFPCKADSLPSLPLFTWGNLLFTTLNKKEEAPAYLSEMMERLHWLPLEEFIYQPRLSKSFTIDANWALYCKNYPEGFHIPFVHAGLNAALIFGDYTTVLYAKASLQLGVSKDKNNCFNLPKSSVDDGTI